MVGAERYAFFFLVSIILRKPHHSYLSPWCFPLHLRHPLERYLDRVLTSPLPCRALVLGPRRLVDVGNLGNERVVGVGVGKHRADGEKNCESNDRLARQ